MSYSTSHDTGATHVPRPTSDGALGDDSLLAHTYRGLIAVSACTGLGQRQLTSGTARVDITDVRELNFATLSESDP